jgi:hypothetical protein
MAVYKGNASVTQTQLQSTRSFALRTDSLDSTAGADLSGYTLNAGGNITLTYRTGTDGASAPSESNSIILRVYYETGTTTLIKELYNGAPIANGTTFTFYATDNGESNGSPRAGTLRLYVQAIRTDLGAYNINSDSTGNQGVIRSNSKVSDLSVSSYPSGSTFAYGTASNEIITLTATHAQPYDVRGHETIRIDSLDSTTQQVAGSVKDIGSSTTTTQTFTVSDIFDNSANTYGMEFLPIGSAQLVPDSEPNMLWTSFIDDGSNVEQNSDNVRQQSFYDVDPRITTTTLTIGETVYNREETATHSFEIINARSENLTRTVNWNIFDSVSNLIAGVNDTGPTYANSRSIGSDEKATNDLIGDTRSITTAVSDTYNKSENIYNVSRLWKIRKEAVSDVGTVFTDKIESPTADNKILYNRGQDVFFSGILYNVRNELLGAANGYFAIRRTDQEGYELSPVSYSLNANSELTGSGATYIVPLTSVTNPDGRSLVYTSSTSPQPRTGTNGTGNFAETDISTPEWTITDQYIVECRLQKEPIYDLSVDEDVVFTIGSDAIYSYGVITDAVGDPVPDALVLLKQYDPNGIQSALSEESTLESGITIAASFQPNTPKGEWRYTASTSYQGNTGFNEQLSNHVSAFTADKAIISGFAPVEYVPSTVVGRQTAKPGDLPKPGDRLLTGVAFTVNGVRKVITITPQFQLSRLNQANAAAQILQSDYTWKEKTDVGYEDYFFDFKVSTDSDLVWLSSFGVAAQGVTAENGYVTDTSAWNAGSVFEIVRVNFEGQPFYKSMNHNMAGPSTMHSMDGVGNQFFDWE